MPTHKTGEYPRPNPPSPEAPPSSEQVAYHTLQESLKALVLGSRTQGRASLGEIARMLDAQDFLHTLPARQGGGMRFDIGAYVERELKRSREQGKPLIHLPSVIEKIPDVVFPPGEGEIKEVPVRV